MPARYCYRCTEPGCQFTEVQHSNTLAGILKCRFHDAPMRRDYRAEGVGTAIANLKREREWDRAGDGTGGAASILPTHDDFKGPGDPDGKKGLRAWREEHEPRSPGHGDPIGDMVARDRLST